MAAAAVAQCASERATGATIFSLAAATILLSSCDVQLLFGNDLRSDDDDDDGRWVWDVFDR